MNYKKESFKKKKQRKTEYRMKKNKGMNNENVKGI